MEPIQEPADGFPGDREWGEPLDRETLLAAPVRSPRPGDPRRAADQAEERAELSEAAAGVRDRNLGDLLRHLPHSYDQASPVRLRRSELAGHGRGRASRSRKVRPTRRRLTILEAEVGDDGARDRDLVRPTWLMDGSTPEQGCFCSQDSRSARLRTSRAPSCSGPRRFAGSTPASRTQFIIRPPEQYILGGCCASCGLAGRAAGRQRPGTAARGSGFRTEVRIADALVRFALAGRRGPGRRGPRRLAFEELLLYQASLGAAPSPRPERAGRR